MARHSKTKPASRTDNTLLDQRLGDRPHGPALLSESGLLGELKKRLATRTLATALEVHPTAPEQTAAGNHRNRTSSKTVEFAAERLVLDIPRDRHGQLAPALIPTCARSFPGFDTEIIVLHVRGMSTCGIQAHVRERWGVKASPALSSEIINSMLTEVSAWQQRPLESTYAMVLFGTLRVKISDEGAVQTKAAYLPFGITCSGQKSVLGLQLEQTEGAKPWLRVVTDLQGGGVQDVQNAVMDGLNGFPVATTAILLAAMARRASSTCSVAALSSRPAGSGGLSPRRRG
jgi:transposase-like protein